MCHCVFACVSLCAYACLSVSVCLIGLLVFLCACLYVCMCLLVCLHVSVCLSVSLWVVYMSVDYVSVSAFVCICLCPCTYVGALLGVTLRRKGLLVHVYTPVTCLGQWYPLELSHVVGFVHTTKHHHTVRPPASVERREKGILGGQ